MKVPFFLLYLCQSSGKYQPRVEQLTAVAPHIVDMGCFDRIETNGGAFEQVQLLYGENPNTAVREWLKPFNSAGILISGAVSTMMSTASSQLIVVSSSITEDLWSNISGHEIPERRMLFLNTFLTLMVGVMAFILVLTIEDTVYGTSLLSLERYRSLIWAGS